MRTTWLITSWFRTQSYYDHGGWRATWKGEGGGVLLDQTPHNLDLYQWLVGMPKERHRLCRVSANIIHIEVQDEVTAWFQTREWDDRAFYHLHRRVAGDKPGWKSSVSGASSFTRIIA